MFSISKNPTSSQAPSLKIHEAWKRGYSGQGVLLAFVDDGVETTHTDLIGNYVSTNVSLVF